MKLTKSQKEAMDLLLKGQNVFLTGEAGTGKSFLLNQFVTKVKDKNVLLTAPTGIAALNINGATLHRTFHLATDIVGLAQEPTENSISDVVKKADILIIDEISMCRLDVFEKVLKSILKADRKVQIVLVGDFLQLPPVLVEKEKGAYESYHGKKIFAFESDLWKEFNFVTKQKPATKEVKTTGRKRKYNGLETKVMRLPSKFEGLFNALSDKLSDKKHTKKEIEEITKSLLSSIK